MGTPDRHQFFALRDRGRQRPINQDYCVAEALPNGSLLLAVADGVGGARAGEVASEETVHALLRSLRETDEADPVTALSAAATEANDRVLGLSRGEMALSGMATTLVAVLVADGAASIANVGDSRAYRLRKGTIEALTTDDSWVEEQVRAGLLSREEAERSPYRNAITRGIGIEEQLDLSGVATVPLEDGDVLLLCSDGLYRMVETQDMARVIKGATPERAAYRLIDMANDAGGIDNISVVIYRHEQRR